MHIGTRWVWIIVVAILLVWGLTDGDDVRP